MRIKNIRRYDVYLPYAGKSGGRLLKAGDLSPDLEPNRFYHPLLKRDWHAGVIELVCTDADRAYLGAQLEVMRTEAVKAQERTNEKVEEPPKKPEPKVEVKPAKPVKVTKAAEVKSVQLTAEDVGVSEVEPVAPKSNVPSLGDLMAHNARIGGK